MWSLEIQEVMNKLNTSIDMSGRKIATQNESGRSSEGNRQEP